MKTIIILDDLNLNDIPLDNDIKKIQKMKMIMNL